MIRRDFIKGLGAAICAPYICRDSGLLMPIADRRLVSFFIEGRDKEYRPIAELVRISRRRAAILNLPNTPERQRFVDGVWDVAHRRGNLVSSHPLGVGPYEGDDGLNKAVIKGYVPRINNWQTLDGRPISS